MNVAATQIDIAASALLEAAESSKFHVVSCDSMGSFHLTDFANTHRTRLHEVGAAEAASLAFAFGLANTERRVVVVGFSSFLLSRGFEILRSLIAYHSANVALLGGMAGLSHGRDGYMHQIVEDLGIVKQFDGMHLIVPSDPSTVRMCINYAVTSSEPVYVRLTRLPISHPLIASGGADGLVPFRKLLPGDDVALITYGMLVPTALDAALELADAGLSTAVFEVLCHRPFPLQLLEQLRPFHTVITVEDHRTSTGIFADIRFNLGHRCKLLPLGITDTKQLRSGSVPDLLQYCHLTKNDIVAYARSQL